MKSINSILIKIISIIIVGSCSAPEKIEDKITTYTIDPFEVEQSINIKDIVDTAKLVFLETINESLIGSIDKVEIYNDRLFVLDVWKSKSLFMFDIEGNFISKIGSIGDGPGEYEELGDFYIDRQKERIVLIDVFKLIYYGLDGQFIREKRFDDYMVSKGIPLNNKIAFISGGTEDLLIFSDTCLEPINSYFPYTIRTFSVSILHPLQAYTNHKALLRRYLVDTVYLLNDDGVSPHAIYSFGDYTLTRDRYLELSKKKGAGVQKILDETNYCKVFNYFETENHIFLIYRKKAKRYFTLITKETDEYINVQYKKYINPYTFESTSLFYPIGKSKGSIIFQAQPHIIIEGRKQFLADHESTMIDPDVAEKMDKLTEISNPVLLLIDFK